MTGYERIRAVRALRGLSVVQKAVLFVLVSYADNRTGGAWPSVATLSLEAGCSERAVQYSLAELVKLGHLEAWERPRQTTVYTLGDLRSKGAPAGGDGRRTAGGSAARSETRDACSEARQEVQRRRSNRQRLSALVPRKESPRRSPSHEPGAGPGRTSSR